MREATLFIFLISAFLISVPALADEVKVSPQLNEVTIGWNDRPNTVITLENPNERIPHFEKDAKNYGINMEITECQMLIDIPVGTAHGNHSYGGYCQLQNEGKKRIVEICDDDMVGHFEISFSPVSTIDKRRHIEFVASNCYGG
jgi:hypothetical protein